jgi:hypothetical protein
LISSRHRRRQYYLPRHHFRAQIHPLSEATGARVLEWAVCGRECPCGYGS